jgi:hypothetical protein
MMTLGIDPGNSGGAALLSGDHLISCLAEATPEAIWSWLGTHNAVADSKLSAIVIEDAPTHTPSSKALRSLALAVGRLEGYLSAKLSGTPILRPSAQVWQRRILGAVPKGQSKAYALAKARQLWPEETWLATARSKVPHDGIVDSALLAKYGQLTIN